MTADTIIHNQKRELRRKMLNLRDKELSYEQVREQSRQICNQVLFLREFQEADAVLMYASYRHEVDTEAIRRYLYELSEEHVLSGYESSLEAVQSSASISVVKKTTAYPKVLSKEEMAFYIVEQPEDLTVGYKGITEPDETRCRLFSEEAYARIVVLVPGAAFDRRGYRVGYGGGYYDRYLSLLLKKQSDSMSGNCNGEEVCRSTRLMQFPEVTTIALCLTEQLCDKIPAEETDIPVDIIVTPGEIIRRTEDIV